MNPYNRPRMTAMEKEQKRIAIDRERSKEEYELLKSSGYELIFPVLYDQELMKEYSRMLRVAKDLQDEFTHGKVKVNFRDNIYDQMLAKEQQALREHETRKKMEEALLAKKEKRSTTAVGKRKPKQVAEKDEPKTPLPVRKEEKIIVLSRK